MNFVNKEWRERIVDDSLHRSGVIIERAKREWRSLNKMERNVILSGRHIAGSVMTPRLLNSLEMAGMKDKKEVLSPIQVKACFSYYNDPFENIPATAEFLILESNHPNFVFGSHVCAENLVAENIKVPNYPSFEKWVKRGRKIYTKKVWFL